MSAVFSYSEAGGHDVNEDSFAVQPHPADPSCWLCVLADGQGGQAGGAEAAQLATHTVIEALTALPVDSLSASATWNSVFRRADEAVCKDGRAGFTTLVGFAIAGRQIIGASSGDSAVCLIDAGDRIFDLTRHQIKNPPVGSGAAVFVPFAAKLPESWSVLAMSDGVWKYVGWDRICELAAKCRGEALLSALQQQARLSGSGKFQDDFTAVIVQDRPTI